jgi:hypothetical protein
MYICTVCDLCSARKLSIADEDLLYASSRSSIEACLSMLVVSRQCVSPRLNFLLASYLVTAISWVRGRSRHLMRLPHRLHRWRRLRTLVLAVRPRHAELEEVAGRDAALRDSRSTGCVDRSEELSRVSLCATRERTLALLFGAIPHCVSGGW